MKSLLFFINLLGAFIMQIADDLVTTIIYMAITVIVGWVYLLIWGFAGSFLKDLLNKYDLPFRIVMSLLLVYSAISIFLYILVNGLYSELKSLLGLLELVLNRQNESKSLLGVSEMVLNRQNESKIP